jgi:hypothetical protein
MRERNSAQAKLHAAFCRLLRSKKKLRCRRCPPTAQDSRPPSPGPYPRDTFNLLPHPTGTFNLLPHPHWQPSAILTSLAPAAQHLSQCHALSTFLALCLDAQTGLLGWVAFGFKRPQLGAGRSRDRDYLKRLLLRGRAGTPPQADDYAIPPPPSPCRGRRDSSREHDPAAASMGAPGRARPTSWDNHGWTRRPARRTRPSRPGTWVLVERGQLVATR